jgi:hypothetical protein
MLISRAASYKYSLTFSYLCDLYVLHALSYTTDPQIIRIVQFDLNII